MSLRDLADADQRALAAFLAVRPSWCGEGRAADLVRLPRGTLLHAGPPLRDRRRPPRPILNSACVAAVYEGLADSLADARSMIEAGEMELQPAQDFAVVTPLAAVISSSMRLHRVVDAAASDGKGATQAYAPINGGAGPAPRLGLCDMAVVEHLRWLNGPFAEELARARETPLDLIQVADAALASGDDGHGRTAAATAILARRLAPALGAEATAFLAAGPSFFLNLWMAACKCMLLSAVGIADSSLLVAAGANGEAFGLKVAGLPERWFTAPALPPRGDLGSWPADRALGAIGDSAIVDVTGFGAMAMAHAPAQLASLGRFMPPDGLARPALLFARRHGGFRRLVLHSGLCARRVVAIGRQPLISLGILDAQGEAGRIAGGIFETPGEPFAAAVAALDAGRARCS